MFISPPPPSFRREELVTRFKYDYVDIVCVGILVPWNYWCRHTPIHFFDCQLKIAHQVLFLIYCRQGNFVNFSLFQAWISAILDNIKKWKIFRLNVKTVVETSIYIHKLFSYQWNIFIQEHNVLPRYEIRKKKSTLGEIRKKMYMGGIENLVQTLLKLFWKFIIISVSYIFLMKF